jgi:ANTAR domain-containing protein/GAF domain-containing protein
MTESRTLTVWGQVAAHAAAHGRRVSVADVCAVAVSSAELAGGWLAAARGSDPDFVMCVTDQVGEQLAELQLTLGEGPCHDVLVSAAPVLAADLGDAESARRWPGFAPAARKLGAGAVFAFPLTVGAIRAGVLGLYRGSPGSLPDRQLGDLLILADAATVMLLASAHGNGGTEDGAWLDGQAGDLALHRAEIDQATGMLTVQLDVPAAEAFARLRAYAYSQDRRLADVAGDIVARRLRLPRDQDPGGGP